VPAAPDFRLYYGNALDVLAELLARELRNVPPGVGLFEPDTILIPQPTMRRWLQKTLAEKHGIAANLRFLAPGEFVGELLKANVPDADDARTIEPSRLVWRLYATLHDRSTRAHPAIAPVLERYLGGVNSELNAWSLANVLADVFAKYQAWRRDWLLAWDRGDARDDWQAELWRRATRGLAHRAQAIDRFLELHGSSDSPAPRGLPARVFAFACLNVSPDVLRVMTAAARGATLHFYLPTPTRKYWGDLRTLRERLAEPDVDPLNDTDNPLLAAWGRAGRDFIATLFSYELVTPSEIEFYAEPAPPHGLLQRLQLDLLERRAPSGCIAVPPPVLAYQVNVVPFTNDANFSLGTPSGVLGSALTSLQVPPYANEGYVTMDLVSGDGGEHLLPGGIDINRQPVTLDGLPVAGFMVYNIINAQAQPSLLANYGGAFVHRATASCVGDTVNCAH